MGSVLLAIYLVGVMVWITALIGDRPLSKLSGSELLFALLWPASFAKLLFDLVWDR